MRALSASPSEVANEMHRSLVAIGLRQVEVFKKIFAVDSSQHRVSNQVLSVLEAPDRIERGGPSSAHEMAVVLQIKHRIWDCQSLQGMLDMAARHISLQRQMRSHNLQKSSDCSVSTSEHGVCCSTISFNRLSSCNGSLIKGDTDCSKNCSDATYSLDPCGRILSETKLSSKSQERQRQAEPEENGQDMEANLCPADSFIHFHVAPSDIDGVRIRTHRAAGGAK